MAARDRSHDLAPRRDASRLDRERVEADLERDRRVAAVHGLASRRRSDRPRAPGVAGPRERMNALVEIDAGAAGHLRLDGTAGLATDERGASTLGAYDLTLALADVDPARIQDGRAVGIDRPPAPGGGARDRPRGRRARGDRPRDPPLPPGRRRHRGVPRRRLRRRRSLGDSAGGRVAGERRVADRRRPRQREPRRRRRGHRPRRSTRAAGQRRRRRRGHVELHAEGELPDRLSVRSQGSLSAVRVGRVRVRTGHLRFDLRGPLAAPSGALTVGARDVVLGPDAPERSTASPSTPRGAAAACCPSGPPSRDRACAAACGRTGPPPPPPPTSPWTASRST